MATPQVKDLVLRSPAGSCEVVTFSWPLQIGTGQDKHDNGIDIIDTIKFVCDELPSISSAFEEINLNQIDTACYKTMTNLVDRFNKAVDSIVALEKGTSLPAERLNKFAHPSLLRHILQLVYNAAVLDPDKLNNYEPFSPEVYGETSYELVQQMIKHVNVSNDDTFIDLGSGVGQVVLQMAGSFPLKTCIGIEKADTPAQYAERMDLYFRQFMAWFGKRYCEYKLIKGDFLVSEHREKITSSTLVFVNNFAFGPNVDHQLKERFADLRDGARIVSSKSFCPLNFRITDRNLSDIGTIMHLSEIPPLKGSVSWTCKPVSYYLHVIDRTILERYFQRMKTQKGVDHEHVGSTRTTRDRAKREAHHTLHNNNNNTTSSFSITSTTSGLIQNTASYNHNNNNSNSSTTTNGNQAIAATNGLKSRQQQRNVDVDTSTESDGDAVNGGGGSSNTTATVNGCGPMTRKGWSDWCSPKCDKSSQSDDEENNNSNNYDATRAGVRGNANAPKKRKKLTRKAAIASKSAAAAAQREAALGKENTSTKEDNASQNARGRKGRTKKGARGRKSLKIAGLDVLHKQTLLSTSVEMLSKKLPPAPGCVDQQLTSLLTDNMSHTELDIPTAPQDTPYALQILLDVFRAQYMVMIDQLKSPQYVPQLQRQIQVEQEHKQRLKNRASQLDKQIKVLIDDSVALLKQRMNELGISVSSPNELIAKAKEIVGRHKELQTMAKRIQTQVTACELEQRQLLQQQLQNLPTYRNWYDSGINNNFNIAGANKPKVKCSELSESAAHELVLREIANTLATRKKLYAQVASLQTETVALEQTVEEKSANMIVNTTAQKSAASTTSTAPCNATIIADNANMTNLSNNVLQQPLQLTTTNILKSNISNIVPNHLPIQVTGTATGTAGKFTKSPRRQHSREQRDARLRAQEWPDVPDVGKIEESNPEVLAQKILETGRQIEAGKFVLVNHNNININTNKQQIEEKPIRQNSYNNQNCFLSKRRLSGERTAATQNASNAMYMTVNDNSLMPAPILRGQQQSTVITSATATQRANMSPGSVVSLLPICKESPKVANFEHRLKSIITTVLNEDQEQRKQKQQQQTHSSLLLPEQNSPIAKRKLSAVQQQQQQQEPSQMSISTNQNNTSSNASTASSTSVSTPANYVAANKFLVNAHNKNHQMPSSIVNSSAVSSMVTAAYSSAHKYISTKDAAKYQLQQQQQQQQPPHMAHMYATNLALHRRRPTVTAASFEQFAVQQQQQLQHQQEFKAPNMSRSASREHLNDMELPPQRSSAVNSDTAVPQPNVYYERLVIAQPNAKNIATSTPITERCNNHDVESVTTPPVVYTPSRPNSTSSQPDYTQVSPAKMALRRHLSQEKLNQLHNNTTPTPTTTPTLIVAPLSTKTIGDLVNGEIERTLEISHQSIINAVVNKSTVGSHNSCNNNSNNSNSAVVLTSIYNTERERLPLHERLLINPNVQRPERVNVRVIDEHHAQHHGLARKCSTPPIKTTSSAHGNLNTLAQVAYNHKLMQANSATDGRSYTTYNQQQPTQQQQHQSALSNNLLSVSNGRQYQAVALPRAEINGCIEAYFNEDHAPPQAQQQQQHHEQPHYHAQQQHLPLKVKEHRGTIGGRSSRLNGGSNPPLEGLAASLQVHVLASRKFKEEHEERQRRAINSNHVDETSNHNHYQQAQSQEQQQQQQQQVAINGNLQHHNNRSPVKVEIGIKRTSPMATNQPRPSKMPHYSHESNLTQQQYHQIHQQQQQNQQIYPYATHCKGMAHITATTSSNMQPDQDQRQQLLPPRKKIEPISISPEMNSLINDERLHYHNEQAQQQAMVVQQFHALQPAKNSRSTPISVSGRNGEDDDVIIDDETHWQHRVSSGFDRLVAFASTELHKTRHSIDADTVPASISCNTSPDSGITNSSSSSSSNNSDVARTFLSTSSTSSQLDLPLGTNSSSSSSGCSVGTSTLHPHQTHLDHVNVLNVSSSDQTDGALKSMQCGENILKISASPVNASVIESPPLSDVGLPRTPSPNVTVTPPLALSIANANAPDRPPTPPNSANSNSNASTSDVLSAATTNCGSSSAAANVCRIPLKYQRKSKTMTSEKHYKKKFCERNWEFDCHDDMVVNEYNGSNSNLNVNAAVTTTESTKLSPGKSPKKDSIASNGSSAASSASTIATGVAATVSSNINHHHHHKSSKFRPKGKDWDWSHSESNNRNKIIHE